MMRGAISTSAAVWSVVELGNWVPKETLEEFAFGFFGHRAAQSHYKLLGLRWDKMSYFPDLAPAINTNPYVQTKSPHYISIWTLREHVQHKTLPHLCGPL